jgi:DNA polymerase I-like protein with 3'-5' exonuclease and polymerase domains
LAGAPKRHGIEQAAFDDTMLMSYVLESGNANAGARHGLDALSERWLGHTLIADQGRRRFGPQSTSPSTSKSISTVPRPMPPNMPTCILAALARC